MSKLLFPPSENGSTVKGNNSQPFSEGLVCRKTNSDKFPSYSQITERIVSIKVDVCTVFNQNICISASGRGYETFFTLNPAECANCPANKCQITNNCKFCLAKHS